MRRILIANDDGIEAEGILVLKRFLENDFDVYVVAPDRERSATSHSISLHDPIRVKEVEKGRIYAINGTPVDAVHVALLGLIRAPVDVVITGINRGLNLGSDVFYSGTVAAAFQAAVFDKPGIAISIDIEDTPINYKTAAFYAKLIIDNFDRYPIEHGIILNVNVPNLPIEEVQGIEITRLGERYYTDKLIEREDPKKNKYYWIEGIHTHDIYEEGTDVTACHQKKVSVTPLRLDITAFDYIEKLKKWGFPNG